MCSIPVIYARGAQREPWEHSFLKEDSTGWNLMLTEAKCRKGLCGVWKKGPTPQALHWDMWSPVLGTCKESSLVLASNQHKAGLSYFTWELTKPFMVTHEEDFSEAWCSLHMDHNFLNKELSRD